LVDDSFSGRVDFDPSIFRKTPLSAGPLVGRCLQRPSNKNHSSI
jgi:hypothetical protein